MKPHSSASPVPVISGNCGCVPIGVAVMVARSIDANVKLVWVWLAPPPTYSVSVVLPGASLENPIPNTLSPACDAHVVAVHVNPGSWTRNICPELYSTHAFALRSTLIENGVDPAVAGQLSTPRSSNVRVAGSNVDSRAPN